jgi:hypothetical protein
MAWQARDDRSYYYRSVRLDGEPHKIYLGFGAAAKQADAEVRARRQRREERRQQLEALSQAHAALAARLDALAQAADLLVRTSLTRAGFHEHHGCWRQRRPDGQPGSVRRRVAAIVAGEVPGREETLP